MRTGNYKVDWKKYFFELVVIVTGITISFMVQNWQEDRQFRKSEIRILERIYNDLTEDTSALKLEGKVIENIVRNGVKLLNFKDVRDVEDSLNIFLLQQLQYTVFTKTDIGYQTLQQSGLTQHISNKTLLGKIIRLYSLRYKEMEEYGTIDKTFVLNHFIPFFNERFPYVENLDFKSFGLEKILPIIQSDSFKNQLRNNLVMKKQGVIRYREAVVEITGLMQEIREEIQRLQ